MGKYCTLANPCEGCETRSPEYISILKGMKRCINDHCKAPNAAVYPWNDGLCSGCNYLRLSRNGSLA